MDNSEILRKLAEASLQKQGGKEVIETSKPVFGQIGQNVRFRSSLPSQPQEAPVDYAKMNNPETSKDSSDKVQQFIDKLKEQNQPSRKPASDEGSLKVEVNPAEKEFNQKRSSEALNRSIEYMNNLPDDIEARQEAFYNVIREGQLSPEDHKRFIEWADEDYQRLVKQRKQ